MKNRMIWGIFLGLMVLVCSCTGESNSDGSDQPILCEPLISPAQPYDPASPAYAVLSKGFAHVNATEFDSAVATYERAIEVDSTDPAGYYGLAFAHSNLSQTLDAVYYYSKVIQLDSSYRKAYYNRAFESMGMQQYMDAKKDLDRAIELDPADPDAFINRGICKYSLGDYDGACKDWNRVCAEKREGIVDVYYKETCLK